MIYTLKCLKIVTIQSNFKEIKIKLITKFKNHTSCHLDIEKDESNLFHIFSNNK